LNGTQLWYSALQLYNLGLQANDAGDYFPIFGHCMGFELLAILTSEDPNILDNCSCENISLSLDFTEGAENSRWMENCPSDIYDILGNDNVCLNNHVECVFPSTFQNNKNLNSFYSVISTNVDRIGNTFISTWEANDYPIYGIQWHAEKPQFEWHPTENIVHTPEAIEAMQYFSEFLVDEARKNNHQYPSYEEEYNALIYNYDPYYTQAQTGDFEQCYVF